MEWTNTEKMIVPQSGLPDGIIHEFMKNTILIKKFLIISNFFIRIYDSRCDIF
ncbi:MAG: hypothetical protein CM1200mP1_01590 [Candidatus Neomarinimicrobiota bacterium]|nr:MAG: hypothetical protein CM1200mP1_01590 [Candidatus Neomarinimicrobiota bacterium]